MIGINKKNLETAISGSLPDFTNKSLDILSKLKEFKIKNSFLKNECVEYLDNIINEFGSKNFISLSLADLEKIKNKIGEVPKYKRRFNGKKKATYLKDEILFILNYKEKRNSLYPQFFKKIGIKACVYCNAQLTITVEEQMVGKKSTKIEYKAKFQLDHFYSKDKYPHLSIAFFNLYPVCASCNLAKSNKTIVDFRLYVDKILGSDFKFELDSKSKAKFLITRDSEDLKITFKNVKNPRAIDVFKINDIYKTQYDVAEEIILKSLAYNTSYRQNLIKEFGKHRISDGLINRFILGNYTKENEIHKRPLAKFMQDIGKQTGLI